MELFLINAQLTITSLVAQGFGPFQDVSIKRVSMLGWFDPSISEGFLAFSIIFRINNLYTFCISKSVRYTLIFNPLYLHKQYDTQIVYMTRFIDLYRFFYTDSIGIRVCYWYVYIYNWTEDDNSMNREKMISKTCKIHKRVWCSVIAVMTPVPRLTFMDSLKQMPGMSQCVLVFI